MAATRRPKPAGDLAPAGPPQPPCPDCHGKRAASVACAHCRRTVCPQCARAHPGSYIPGEGAYPGTYVTREEHS